jgi:glycosyltransferase involved in cell wall biosynthesis
MRILCFVDYYLPGYRAGGPMRTIENMVEHLGDEIQFLIVTRDRDMGLAYPYPDVHVGQWNKKGKAEVLYLSPEMLNVRKMIEISRSNNYDSVYLNSYFSLPLTVMPLLLRLIGFFSKKPVIIAPRGEFSAGALSLKQFRKRAFILFAKFIGLYEGLVWQASGEMEKTEISAVLGNVANNIVIAPDLLSLSLLRLAETATFKKVGKKSERLRIVFVSRISRKKNLQYLLTILGETKCDIHLSIVGPIEDANYWSECNHRIKMLPNNISVVYRGDFPAELISSVFSDNDLFVFPTLGENFGHVIIEALAAGTGVIVSNLTPWKADANGVLTVLTLDSPRCWQSAIELWATYDVEKLNTMRLAAKNYALNYFQSNNSIKLNRLLFAI